MSLADVIEYANVYMVFTNTGCVELNLHAACSIHTLQYVKRYWHN